MASSHANDFECELDTPETEIIPSGWGEDGALSVHDTSYHFCGIDPKCPCHENPILIGEVNTDYQDGLLTANEASDITRGWTL